MTNQLSRSLKNLFESSNNIHMTAYVESDTNLDRLKKEIQMAINQASDHLCHALSLQEEERFLQPVRDLLDDESLLKKLKGTIGIFRTPDSFRVMSIPIEVEAICVVATTFHVKPLFKWIQADREFILVGLDDHGANLYRGNLNSMKKIGEYKFKSRYSLDWLEPKHSTRPKQKLKGQRLKVAMASAADWVYQMCEGSDARMYIAGKRNLTNCFAEEADVSNLDQFIIGYSFSKENIALVSAEVRAHLQAEVRMEFERNLIEFQYAEVTHSAKRNLLEIAADAINGRVRKLLISDGVNLFGKLCRQTGRVSLHPRHLDHEDDDLLDDLAQEVMAHGGQVLVASHKDMPLGRSIIAIVDDSTNEKPTALALIKPRFTNQQNEERKFG
ncbi:hypothetical protein GW915_07045 [bacterium]|nr:hypothetical protein [bacterium]